MTDSRTILGFFESAVAAVDHRLTVPTKAPAVSKYSSRDVSVVVQGPVHRKAERDLPPDGTRRCLESVRRALPNAEVILSTWKGSDVSGLPADRIIFNVDPGPTAPRYPIGATNNVNRQVVSTRAGLEHATRPLGFKLRTDMELEHGEALALIDAWPERSNDVRVLHKRVVVPTYYNFNPRRVYPRLVYAYSDWCHLGLLEDLLAIWSTPHWDPSLEWLLGNGVVTSEQFIWMSLFNRHGHGATLGRPDAIEHSERLLANNVAIVSLGDLGLRFRKFVPIHRHRTATYTHAEWLRLYQRHCCGQRWRGLPDSQSILRTAVAHGWITGLGAMIFGMPDDIVPETYPSPPDPTPNEPIIIDAQGATSGADPGCDFVGKGPQP